MIEPRERAGGCTSDTAAFKSERLDHGTLRDGLEAVIHEEVNRLPPRYRIAVVLCDLEGRSHEQAARHMGCAVGTVKSRLARGREKLRGRLVRRGLAPETCVVAAGAGRLAVPPALVEATVRSAMARKRRSGRSRSRSLCFHYMGNGGNS